jgi:hypothetical protein
MDDDLGGKVKFSAGKKFDIQLLQGLRSERRFARLLCFANIEFIEIKKEDWLWERTGNIAIEYECRARPSGLNVTEADMWVHDVQRGGETLFYLMFPMRKLRDLVTLARLRGHVRDGGDDGQSKMALIRLTDLLG